MQIFGHRGFSSDYPENTMLAFRKAYEAGADGIELDARLTDDGYVVVMHDPTVDRTTNGTGTLWDMPLSEVQTLDAGIKKGLVFEGEKVPLLEEVFKEFGGKLLINVELVNYNEGDERILADKVGEMIDEYGLRESVIISSFRFNNLVYMKDKHPDVQCGLLAYPKLKGFIARNLLNHSLSVDALHPYSEDINEALVRKEHQCGRKVRAWTVNDPKEIIRLYKIGVDGIYTDNPAEARQIYESEKVLSEAVRFGLKH